MLVPLLLWILDIRDIVNNILMKSLGAGSSYNLDKDGTIILSRTSTLVFLENLRTSCLNAYTIII
jgi:adenine deaminase